MATQDAVHQAVRTCDPQALDRWARDRWSPGTTAGPSARLRRALVVAWLVFVVMNLVLMVLFEGSETIPYHLIWASFALLYGLLPLSRRATIATFVVVTVSTGLPLILHAQMGVIGWAECSEIVLMG